MQCAGGSLRWELNLAWRRDDVDASAGATGGLGDGGGDAGRAGGWSLAKSSPLSGRSDRYGSRSRSGGWPEARPSSSLPTEAPQDVGRTQTLKHAHGACFVLFHVTSVTPSFGSLAADGGHSGVHILPREPTGGRRVRLLFRVSDGWGMLLCGQGSWRECDPLFRLAPRRSSRGVFPSLGWVVLASGACAGVAPEGEPAVSGSAAFLAVFLS